MAYQQKVQADRHHELARATLDLSRQKLACTHYLALHRIPAETYSVNEDLTHVTPFPSLKPIPAEKAIAIASLPFQITPAYDLLDIFSTHEITPKSVFLAKAASGELLFTQDKRMQHTVFSAMTGAGKTTLVRGIVPQLVSLQGHHVVLADLKFTDLTEKGEDWRPVASRLFEQEPLLMEDGTRLPNVLRREEHIAAFLHWMAYPEIQRRLDMRAKRDYSYKTLDAFLEELIALTLAFPSVTKDIIRIVSLGRELRLNLFTTAQNMQVSNVGLNGGAREQFTTAWFLGGDETSAAALLDMPRRELSDYLHTNKIILGEGVGMMRNNYVLPHAGIVRIGKASNEAMYHLLGKADDFELEKAEALFDIHRSYSVPTASRNRNTERLVPEQVTEHTRNAPEQETEPVYRVSGTPEHLPEIHPNEPYNPFQFLKPEQRNKVLEAVEEKHYTSLREIRKYAGISNETHKFRAMKHWLELNGHTFHLRVPAEHPKQHQASEECHEKRPAEEVTVQNASHSHYD